jgi:hypothetical protein
MIEQYLPNKTKVILFIRFILFCNLNEALIQHLCVSCTANVAPARAMFRSLQNVKSFQDSPSHRIYRHMYGALNIGKKITNYIVCL